MAYTPPIDVIAPIYGGLAWFARDGETIEAVTVADDTAPAGIVFTDWDELGCIESATLARDIDGGEDVYCFNAISGVYEKTKTVGRIITLAYELTLNKVTEFMLQVAHNAADVDADGEFVPNSQRDAIYHGWFFVQQQNGTEVTTVLKVRAELSMTQAMQIAARTAGRPQLRLEVIGNVLNEGQMGTAGS